MSRQAAGHAQPPAILGLSGFAQSGKDLAAIYLAEFGYRRLAFADKMREALYRLNPTIWASDVQSIVDMLGWDQAKTRYPQIRELMQRMGTEVGRELFGEDFWVNLVMKQIIRGMGDKVVITDVRFENEVDAVHRMGGRVFRIVRDGVGPVNAHRSDSQALQVDGVIPNNSTKEQFRLHVLAATGVDYPRVGANATSNPPDAA